MEAFPSTRGTLAYAFLVCCLSVTVLRAESRTSTPRTEVIFGDADSYTDYRLSDSGDWYRDAVFTAVRSYLVRQTDQLLPDGYNLRITIKNIDLGHRASRRIPSSSGAPAFEFTYLVTDTSGQMVRQGTENLRNYTDFGNYRFSVETTDLATEIIQEEKPMLKCWAVTRLGDLKQR